MDTKRICPGCQKPLAAETPLGLCPQCLLKAGFNTGTEPGTAASGFVPPTVPEIAALLPQLEIIEFIGKGGMGAVYKARQPSLDRMVALKILPPRIGNTSGFAERFNREARALAKLVHPNIVAVHDFGQAGGLNYFIMEFVDGMNLRELERAGRLLPARALAIVPQICDALQFAHNEGIVHRDIKPENILIDKKGRVKITDFGIAKILGQPAEAASLTGAKDVVGTPHYMAPEQIEKPAGVDHRADIFSLGVVFYEMLTGELPLGRFQPPSQKVRMDVRLDEVVLHALEKEPERRYQQVSEVKTRVETISGSPPSQAVPIPAGASETGTPLFPSSFGLTFRSRIALNLARIGWILGCFAATGFLPGMKWMFGFAGFFGLIGLAVLIELIHLKERGKVAVAAVFLLAACGVAGYSLFHWTIPAPAAQAATPAAATETWSPGEKPDFQKILQTAQTLTSEGSYEEALQHFLWYFNHTRNDPGQAGVRLSFALSDWVELGRRYPKAKKALTEIRDADARLLAEGKGYFQLFQEVSGINQYLEEEKLTLDLFATLESHDRQLAGKCYPIVQGLLVQKRRSEKCLHYIGDPVAKFESIRDSRDRMKQFEERNETRRSEQKKRFEEMAKSNPAYANVPPPYSVAPPKFADKHFIDETRELIEILVGANHKADAEKIQAAALTILDDARLKSAVSDAEQKIRQA